MTVAVEAVAFDDAQAHYLSQLRYQELVRLFGKKTGKCRICRTPTPKTVLVGTQWGLRRVQIRNVCGWYCKTCCPLTFGDTAIHSHDHEWRQWGCMTGTPGME